MSDMLYQYRKPLLIAGGILLILLVVFGVRASLADDQPGTTQSADVSAEDSSQDSQHSQPSDDPSAANDSDAGDAQAAPDTTDSSEAPPADQPAAPDVDHPEWTCPAPGDSPPNWERPDGQAWPTGTPDQQAGQDWNHDRAEWEQNADRNWCDEAASHTGDTPWPNAGVPQHGHR